MQITIRLTNQFSVAAGSSALKRCFIIDLIKSTNLENHAKSQYPLETES